MQPIKIYIVLWYNIEDSFFYMRSCTNVNITVCQCKLSQNSMFIVCFNLDNILVSIEILELICKSRRDATAKCCFAYSSCMQSQNFNSSFEFWILQTFHIPGMREGLLYKRKQSCLVIWECEGKVLALMICWADWGTTKCWQRSEGWRHKTMNYYYWLWL